MLLKTLKFMKYKNFFTIVISADGPALCNPDLQMGK